jgi:hypothetical protein
MGLPILWQTLLKWLFPICLQHRETRKLQYRTYPWYFPCGTGIFWRYLNRLNSESARLDGKGFETERLSVNLSRSSTSLSHLFPSSSFSLLFTSVFSPLSKCKYLTRPTLVSKTQLGVAMATLLLIKFGKQVTLPSQ